MIQPTSRGAGGLTLTNLMGINSSGNLIDGFYGSGAAGAPNTGSFRWRSTETELLGLNDNGLADGFSDIGGVMHGILYDSLTKTFTLLDPLGSSGTTLNGINDAGDVVGFFVDAKGNTDGLPGAPVPEPATRVMMLTAFAGLGALGLRRARKVARLGGLIGDWRGRCQNVSAITAPISW